jgi:HEAT repeat protein
MIRQRCTLLALVLLGICVGVGAQDPTGKDPKPPLPPEPVNDGSKEDLKILREGNLKGEGPDLLQYFRERTYKQPDPKEMTALVKQLGDDDFQVREKAFKRLSDLGAGALVAIKQGETDTDLEVRKRIADLKKAIESKREQSVQAAAARQLARLKLEGTADVLMAFLPFASDAMVIDEVCKALGAVAVREGRVEPVLVKGLEDPLPLKRGAAGEAIARANVKEELANVKKLLKDGDSSVRLRVCMALVTLGDRDTLPVMVELMGELPASQLWPVEEALLRVAGDKAPAVSLGNDANTRKACRDAWAQWLKANEASIDVVKLAQQNSFLNYTLIVMQNNQIAPGRPPMGEVFELDQNHKPRWKFEVNTHPVDAQVINGNRVVVAEYLGNRVTERDTKGEIKWEYHCGGNPFSVQRLPNGNTFIAMQGRLIEVDRDKNEVWSYQRPQHDIIRARRLPTGEVAFITNIGVNAIFQRMDPKTQKINRQFNIPQVQMLFGNFEVLPNGHIVVPHHNQSRVVEYDQNGKVVDGKTITQQSPNSVFRLPNGNTLIASQNARLVKEYNTNLTEIWHFTPNNPANIFVARKR